MVLKGNVTSDKTGGWTILQFTLQDFYAEHQIYRNIWSQSNCGFDLAKYRGTWFTAYPMQTTDYILWWDTDYGNAGEFKTLTQHVHPAILLNRKHTVVVLSKYTRGQYKPKRFFVPPPSVFDNRWSQMSEWAKRGLVVMGISAIDFTYPWMHPGATLDGWTAPYAMKDWTSASSRIMKEVISKDNPIQFKDFWWMQNGTTGKPNKWAEEWPGWGADAIHGSLSKESYTAVALGPFVVKDQRRECQAILTYRSLWTWGGDILTKDEQVCDPTTGQPKSLRSREPVDPELCITKADIDKSGFINPDKWRILTSSPTPTSRGLTCQFRTGESEEETESTLQAETDEESEDPSPKRSRSPRRRVDGRRIEHLLRLQRLLKKISPNKSWSI